MNETSPDAPKRRITLERTYRARIEDVWELWTTKDGIESWWGPGGFAVKVRKLELRPGGELHYAMTAIAPPQIEFMKKAGMPLTTEARLTYTEIVAPRRLASTHLADFIPGVAPPQIEFMKKAGMPLTTDYTDIVAPRRLAYTHLADFIPGVAPYGVATLVELHPTAEGVRLVLTFDAMHDEEWTQRAAMGWESELGKLAKVLEK